MHFDSLTYRIELIRQQVIIPLFQITKLLIYIMTIKYNIVI